MAARESRPTTIYEILRDAIHAGHTTLTLDEVAADAELRDIYGVGLHDLVVVVRAPAKLEASDYRRRPKPWRMRVRYRNGGTFEPSYVSESHREEAIRLYVAQGHVVEKMWKAPS